MSIPSVASARAAAPAADGAAGSAGTRPAPPTDFASLGADLSLQNQPPTRFPWLSRLSEQLESTAPQKPAFPAAPVLGDLVDKSV